MSGPDLTAVGAAFGRAAHVILDEPPWVLEDTLSITLADESTLRAAQLLTPDGQLAISPDDNRSKWRGAFVGRARFVEDLVTDRLTMGVEQYVILGAGLDTFAWRRPDLAAQLRIFEVDEAGTQRWKSGRLRDLAMSVPESLRFVPVDFESGQSWVEAICERGFDIEQPAVIASTGVAQYISTDALTGTLRAAAKLAPGTTLVCTCVTPIDLIDDATLKELRLVTEARAAARGFPWISFYSPDEFVSLALAAGFSDVRFATPDVNERYFAQRADGLRFTENLFTASRRA